MQQIQTFDLYEGSFYLSRNCSIETIEAITVDGKVNCRITIAGESIHTLQASYFSGEAEIRLFDFRRIYSQLQKLVHDAKRKYKLQMKHSIRHIDKLSSTQAQEPQQYAGGQV